MSDIGVAAVVGRPIRVTGLGNISALWKGPLILENRQIAANCWIKTVTLPELVLECFGHLLAKEVGLPYLRPLVVSDPANLLGHSAGCFFATEDAGVLSMRQLGTNWPPLMPHYQYALKKWQGAPTLAVLDELMANGDRNAGNLLFDGKSRWIPIDYSRAKATGPAPAPSWDGTDVRLDILSSNHLVDLVGVLDQSNVNAAVQALEHARLFLGVLQHFAGFPVPGCEGLAQRMTVWVQDRRHLALRRLVGTRLSGILGLTAPIAI